MLKVNQQGAEGASSRNLTPREVVAELDSYIVGQGDAKRAVAIAVRNRWRRQQLSEEMRAEVAPKNILMIGPTGVGKTEIARRLARLTGAPFIKVEATKYTEVGYYGRDVESMIRELVDNAIVLVRERERSSVEKVARERAEERLLDLLAPEPLDLTGEDQEATRKQYQRTREKMRDMLRTGELDDRKVEMDVEKKTAPMMVGPMGMENMDFDMQGLFDKIMPKNTVHREFTVAAAKKVMFEEECDRLLDSEKINSEAIDLAENVGIVFLDEIDKVVATESKSADVSRRSRLAMGMCQRITFSLWLREHFTGAYPVT